MNLLKKQLQIAEQHFDTTIFVEGIVGTGKTTAAIERIKSLLKAGVPADSILLIVPQATLALPYRTALRRSRLKTNTTIKVWTLGSLTYEMVDLFWPLIAEEAGFAHPQARPRFLSLEMVQYYMTRLVEPVISQHDYFNSVHISRNRLYTQIVDNLNKAAVAGFPHTTISERLKAASQGDREQFAIYDDAQASANLFRDICRERTMLDFSLQVAVFSDFLWPKKPVQRYLTQKYRHLIIDNLEEDTPITHDLVRAWLPLCESALLIFDADAGYRRFLGADVASAYALKAACALHINLDKQRNMSPDVEAFQSAIAPHLHGPPVQQAAGAGGDARRAVRYPSACRYHPQMIAWAVESIAALVHDVGAAPRDIAVLSAFVPDALRFSLQTQLDARGIPSRTHRPSRALRDEPATRTLLTLAKLAHPAWALHPSKYDVTYALTMAVADLDPVRARLLIDTLYREGRLLSFDTLREPKIQSRITFDLGARYESLRRWIEAVQEAAPLPVDVFFSRLFGEVLSQPTFGFHARFDAANAAANLIDSAREFRQTVAAIEPDLDHAPEYVRMVDAGVIGNLYVRDAQTSRQNAVLIAPAYTFLTYNQPVEYQVWLNIGSGGWAQRLYQPLTHPYVLSRQWTPGKVWTDADEVAADQDALYRLTLGLIRRCRKGIYLGYSDLGEQGVEQRGPLLTAVQNMLRRLAKEEQDV